MLTLGAWLHDLDPFMVRLSEGFGIRWYGVSYLAGFLAAFVVLRWLSARGLSRIPRQHVADALMWLVGGVVIGGRLGYILIYDQALLWDFSEQPPWWGVLAINRGGMASHGGMVGVLVACYRISRGWKTPDGEIEGRCPTLHVMDLIAATSVFGLAFGRLANFINGELLGRVVSPAGQTGPWWAVRFPQEALEQWGRLPGAQREALANAVGMTRAQTEDEIGRAVCFTEIQRLIEQLQAGSVEAARTLAPLISARHPSQLYQAAAEGVLVGAVCWLIWRCPRKPGVVSAWFLITYGIGRIITEVWRLPDSHLQVERIAGLSRGQLLSVVMILAGATLLAAVTRRHAERLGGWGTPRTSGA